MKKFVIVVLALIVVGVPLAAYVFRDRIATAIAESLVSRKTEYGLAVGSLHLGVLNGYLESKDIRVLNPRGFREDVMLYIPEVRVTYDTLSVITGKNHVRDARIVLSEAVLVRNDKGRFNFEPVTKQKPGAKEKARKTRFRIDRLTLGTGTIVYKDYTTGREPLVITMKADMTQEFRDVQNLDEVVTAAGKKIAGSIKVEDVQNFDPADLPNLARSALNALPDDTKRRLFGTTTITDKNILDLSEKVLKAAQELKK